MSATIMSEPMVVSAPSPETQATSAKLAAQSDVQFAKCDCCGLTEECTPAYIETVRQRYQGKWICGLCAEAIKDEIIRTERLISTEEAMARHMNFCQKFVSSGPPPDPTVHLISAMRSILRKSLESSRGLRSTPPISPTGKVSKIRVQLGLNVVSLPCLVDRGIRDDGKGIKSLA
ncbi:hypothetical protein E1A91_A09G217500v1 [Gossypium mustelinum]|uniref:DUF1677 domain-containing protein n=1 Tax=Gossypium mustelinum TaxID=34275 RepID=A0A5D2T5T2_GOSMU|nr:hypothetical protein E1A91_D10G064200v1 [Gossypium mustelinum]TYI59834.1 hypothetical protein E1A91_D10G064200v1 [Gossypium mustelinum]TYJ19816.1 hypothetical protein E1A91_A09G217500v1 [Gossypium mustelinum]